ncbi:MAG TPA: carboxypeptidase regulatory-like domain-containing protein, partial [Candidatus Syntrophosphaera sp.]|nr:carboxypeptidase regulatory-like domain-containing protein [Candidatus Syntrophosphaera sp.]
HYIDDISFEQIGADDLGCEALTGNNTPSVGAPTIYNAVIHNWGTATQSTYTVKLFNGNDEELYSVAGVDIAPGGTLEMPLTWTPTAQGEAQLYAKVFLTGDINPANDQSPDLNVLVMPTGTMVVSVGDGTTYNSATGVPTPYGTYYNSFHQQYLFTAAEILAAGGTAGPITSLSFNVQAVNNCSAMSNYTIKLKHTDQAALTTTFEVGDYTQVCLQDIFLPTPGWNPHGFSTPFIWDGVSNLLVDITTTLMPGDYTQNASVYYAATTGNYTSLRYQSRTVDAGSSLTGTRSYNRANVRFSINVSGMAALNGTVTSGGIPVNDVDIVIEGTTYATQTDLLGQYSFPFVPTGNYNVTASKLGYESQTLPVTLVADETTTLNFVLNTSSSVNVTGFVVGSDQPTVGLAEAEVTLVGAMNYNATTDATGHFTIPGVLSGNTYNYMIYKEGYQELSGSITVGATAYDMGTLILSEIAFPPSQVVATENIAQTQVDLIWHSPVAAPPYDDFEMDDGGWVPTASWDPIGDWEWSNTYDIANWAPTYTGTNVIPPPNCYSGTGMWGTKINTNYTNSGGDNNLTKTFNLAGFTAPQLRFWSWENVFGNFDYCQVLVNGAIVWGPSWLYTNTVWTERVVDLSAYAGMANVEITFQMHATTVVNYAGWYIDDVYVGNPPARDFVAAPAITPFSFSGMDELQAATAAEAQAVSNPVARPPQMVQNRLLAGYKVWRLLAANEGNETL